MRSLSAAAVLAISSVACAQVAQPKLDHHTVPTLTVDGHQFADLNRNGKLDIYEDWRQTPQARAADLVRQMSLEERAGVMMHGTLPAAASGGAEASIGRGAGYDYAKVTDMVQKHGINTMITRLGGDPRVLAEADNKLQEIAEGSKFGIPVTISTDPRNSFLYTPGASVETGGFSKWPETTGLAAINDAALTRKFADIVRREYMAVGIREALSPQADLATEPRWPRLNGTFGEDADVAKSQVEAYVEGMQDGRTGLKSSSVITVVKHWVGYGAQQDGLDSHNYYGRYSTITNANLPYAIKPFLGAFDAHVAAVMPTYSILKNVTIDGQSITTGAGYSKVLLTDLLRGKYGFKGVVVSDWGITSDCGPKCQDGVAAGEKPSPANIAMSWGVMDLSKTDRFAKAINAGVDQVGGTEESQYVVDAVKAGKLSEDRVRDAAERILQQKFELGLFENPYVDPAKAAEVVGNAASLKAGEDAQKRAMVPLENHAHAVPLEAGAKVWLYHVSAEVAKARGFEVVASPGAADVCILRAETPFETSHPGYFFGGRQHEGRLNFQPGDPAYDALIACGKTPAVMTVYMDRPAILTEVKDKVAALYADFGVSDSALLDVLTGKAKAEGHLPFELPSSLAAVQAQKSDVPHDSAHPLYPFGYALK